MGAKFAEMTLNQFKAKVQPSLECREKIASLRRQLEAAIKKRQECDAASTDICAKVVNAVRGEIEYGEDSALYKALDYVPKSERKSGVCAARLPSRRRPELRRLCPFRRPG